MNPTSSNVRAQVLSDNDLTHFYSSDSACASESGIKIVNPECYIHKVSEYEAEAESYFLAEDGKGKCKIVSIEPACTNVTSIISEKLSEDVPREVLIEFPIEEKNKDDTAKQSTNEMEIIFIDDQIRQDKKIILSSDYIRPERKCVDITCYLCYMSNKIKKIVNGDDNLFLKVILVSNTFEDVNENIVKRAVVLHENELSDVIVCSFSIRNFSNNCQENIVKLLVDLNSGLIKNKKSSVEILGFTACLFSRYVSIFCGLDINNMVLDHDMFIIYKNIIDCALLCAKMYCKIEHGLGQVRSCKKNVREEQQSFYEALLSFVRISNLVIINLELIKKKAPKSEKKHIEYCNDFLKSSNEIYCCYPKKLMNLIEVNDEPYCFDLFNSFFVLSLNSEIEFDIVDNLFKSIIHCDNNVFKKDWPKSCFFTLEHVHILKDLFNQHCNRFVEKTDMANTKQKACFLLNYRERELMLFVQQLNGISNECNSVWLDVLVNGFEEGARVCNDAIRNINKNLEKQSAMDESSVNVRSKKNKHGKSKMKRTNINTVSALKKDGDKEQKKMLPLLPFQSSSIEKKEGVACTSESPFQVHNSKPESVKASEGLNIEKSDNRQSKIKQHKVAHPLMQKNEKQPLVKNSLVKKDLHDKSGSQEIEEYMPLSSEVDITKGARPKIKSPDTLKQNKDKQYAKDSKHSKRFISSNGKNKKYPIVNTQRCYPAAEERVLSSSSMD
ncbi:MAG: hypothetical protein KAG53_01865 [Endozoicomonadaceae bacterium]|nr:hypothetical protein [Endozoicomonadaceae bacterium]